MLCGPPFAYLGEPRAQAFPVYSKQADEFLAESDDVTQCKRGWIVIAMRHIVASQETAVAHKIETFDV